MANSLIIEGIPTGNVYVGDTFEIIVRDKSATNTGFDSVSVLWIYNRSKVAVLEQFAYHTYSYRVTLLDVGPTALTAKYNGESVSFSLNVKANAVITLDANGGSVSNSTLTAEKGHATLPTPTHDSNHIFMGWFTKSMFGDKIGNAGDTIEVDSDFTAHAQWLYLKYYPLTKNERYIEATARGENIEPKGIMVHSTGANNADLNRYVGPDDGVLGLNRYYNHWNVYHPNHPTNGTYKEVHEYKLVNGQCNVCRGKCACVHAFIGKLADGTVAVYQTLPWNYAGWHSGSGSDGLNGNANNTRFIGFEICEDGYDWENNYTDADWEDHRPYVDSVYYEAVKLCAYLCELYKIEPVKDKTSGIISHKEGNKLGIASQHSDPDHWFEKYNHSMDQFREDVKRVMGKK